MAQIQSLRIILERATFITVNVHALKKNAATKSRMKVFYDKANLKN